MAKLGIVANNKKRRKWFPGSEYNLYNWNKVKRKKKIMCKSVLCSDLKAFTFLLTKTLGILFLKNFVTGLMVMNYSGRWAILLV